MGVVDASVIIAIVHRARTANELICSFVHCKLHSSFCTPAEMANCLRADKGSVCTLTHSPFAVYPGRIIEIYRSA